MARDARRRRGDRRTVTSAEAPKVFLWADTFNNYFHPATMRAAYKVLSDAGFRITVPNRHLCCGRPLYDFGLLDTAKQYLEKVLDALTPEIEAGTPVVVLEPSCASVFRDELTNLIPDDPRARKLRSQVYLLSEFLVKFAPDYQPPKIDQKIVVHGHCHHKSHDRHWRTWHDRRDQTSRATGADVQLLDSGCCGMAGPFGFEKDKYEISQKLGERVLLPAVRNNPWGDHRLG